MEKKICPLTKDISNCYKEVVKCERFQNMVSEYKESLSEAIEKLEKINRNIPIGIGLKIDSKEIERLKIKEERAKHLLNLGD